MRQRSQFPLVVEINAGCDRRGCRCGCPLTDDSTLATYLLLIIQERTPL